MDFLDLTLPSVSENLALDEALLDEAEAMGPAAEYLRLWESPEIAVVLGRSSQRLVEANVPACEADQVSIYRRVSGGCAVVIGPGCLLYSVMLSYELRPELRILDEAHRFVLGRLQQAIAPLVPDVTFQGTSDLTWRGKKFSGNSLRCKRSHLLYHGTILYDFPLEKVARYLSPPPREPEYRAGRRHQEFLTNLPSSGKDLHRAIAASFCVKESLSAWPHQRTERLMEDRYGLPDWHAER